jgi:Bacterial Ig-like domain (group 3)/Bacterial Ig domain
MRRSDIKGTLNIAVIAATILLLGVAMAFGQTTAITLTGSASAISVGQSDTFTANVTPTPAGTLTGTVTFYDNSTQIGTAIPDTTGNATFTTSALPVGPSDSITAGYSGDTTYAGSTSLPYVVTVTLDSTSTNLTASLPTIFAGQSDTLTALVNNTGGVVPTGTVTFYSNGTTQLGTVPLTTGSATLVTSASALTVGQDSITAVYSGDSTYGGDTSNAVFVIVNPDPTVKATPSGDITVITLTNNPTSPVTFTMTVPSNFTIGTGGTCPSSLTLSGGSCTVYLQATDGATNGVAQSQSGTLSVTAVDANNVSVNVIGGSSLALGTGVIPNNGETGLEQVITLSAGPSALTLPDGSTVPMWGYTCGAPVVNSGATCRALNPNAAWSPVVITVPFGRDLEIELTNNLSFSSGNNVPTSMMIVGQVGGGLGDVKQRTTTASPDHSSLSSNTITWPIAGSSPSLVPPPQGPRVRSFGTEVAAGATTDLIWKTPKPGTYLLESGTHPSIQVPMGLYGILVVTSAPTAPAGVETALGCAYPGATAGTCAVPYDAEVPLLLSEIDPVQNTTVNAAVNTTGFSETAVWSGQPGGCGNPASGAVYLTCYPPAVNYTPLYYTINGAAFNKNNTSGSLFPITPATIAPATGTTGSVLVRFVNAGSRMHVPAIVGSQVAGATGGTNPIVTGFKVIAEDGNPLPGVPKIKSEVFMAAGKTYDVIINGQTTAGTTISPYPNALAVYDRELSLSANATARDSGMLAYIGIGGGQPPIASNTTAIPVAPVANPDTYVLVPGQILTVSDQSRGVIANDRGVYIVELLAAPTNGTVTLNQNGTFVYYPTAGITATTDTFTYCANGKVTGTTCSSGVSTTVTLGPTTVADSGITCTPSTFNASMATYLAIKTPGVLAYCKDAANLPLTVNTSTVIATGITVLADGNGGFTATAPGAGTYSFTVTVQNPKQQTATASAMVTFPAGSGLTVNVLDGYDKTTTITDYRWIIEEDRTFYINPNCTANPPPAGCPTTGLGIVPTLGTNFHTSYMPYVAQGCTGALSCEGGQTAFNPATGKHDNVVCDVGNGVCRPDTTAGNGATPVMPGAVALDPTKRYYISILPGDAANPFRNGYAGNPVCTSTNGISTPNTTCGHGMGGAPIAAGQTAVTVITQPAPYPPGKLSVFVFEDDFPLNGEQDSGGGIDVLSPQEPGLGGFQLHLWDAMGGNGDFTGQMTYDMFNQPLTNSLAGTRDPITGNDACPITTNSPLVGGNGATDPTATGITGMVVTCPKYESDGATLSPLAGQAVIANLMPGRWGVIATPGADRIARGEEWLQTNTLDGQKAHDVFTRIGEPSYFQEFGPASYHVSVGFANPAIINARHTYVCNGTDPNSPQPGTPYTCNNTITGKVTGEHLSRTPDERLYSTGSHDAYYWSQCYVSFGDPDGEDFAFTKCNGDGTFTLTNLPAGDWRVTVFDQWNDLLVDGLSTPVGISGGTATTGQTVNMGDIASTQWQANLYTRTFIDDNADGISQADEAGIPFANVAVRLRDGSLENLLVTDFTGTANFNETFPLFSWYVVETDVTRYKNTGTHVVYDVGGPADGSSSCGTTGYPPCGTSTIGKNLANTAEIVSVPLNLRVPGSVYCAGADCTGKSIQHGPSTSDPPSVCTTAAGTPPTTTCSTQLSSGRIDNPWTGGNEGWQGFPGQNNFVEFGKEPYIAGENGGIKGHVVYASTRPFDDPMMLVQTQWTPLVPHVSMNLYQEGFASDGITPTLTLVDHTQTTSWDDYAQGFHLAADGVTKIPNMNCPGQGANSGAIPDLFYFSLYNQPNYLDFYNNVLHSTGAVTQLPNNSQFKCYDGMHNWNQIQPAPYDGQYQFPSVTSIDPTTGKPNGTNCTICSGDPVPAPDLYAGIPMLPSGKYVVEVVLPPGYELVKEEDKNILIGDNYIAPVTQQFGGLGNIFIVPDQASVAGTAFGVGSGYNANNAQNPTQSLGAIPENSIVPGFIPEPIWPCVGEARIVPDFISLYPQSGEVAPFAGATRNLCDRKEVTLNDQMGAIAKFFIYTSTHIASKFTGGITDDYTSEFDPFSPQFGEKFAPPNLPVSVKDWAGNEISRVYADHWGSYDGMTYSTWEVNPPNPTGYSPTMMVFCMNDPGPIPGPGGTLIPDPAFTPGYSQFCYELPFMPGTTQYLDTPVVPTSAFAGAGYNNVDCSYPDATPAVAEVDGDGVGPWVSAGGPQVITITALGNQVVPNYAYSGPSATTAPYNQKTITRHYGFGPAPAGGCSNGNPNAACPSVTVGGIPLHGVTWSDTTITGTVQNNVPPCPVQQQAQYVPAGTTSTQCGQLVITAVNGKQSIDAVTVTIGGKAPTHVPASGTIQSAIDHAAPGDLIIVDPTCSTASGPAACDGSGGAVTGKTTAAHNELLIMWKPVRLQGVGAASSIINANTHPAGKLDGWRAQINCLFGLALDGQPASSATTNPPGNNPYDPTGGFTCGSTGGTAWMYFNAFDGSNAQVDPIPGEAVIGWDATQNGNLAQLLQEPSLMGALEGAGITVLAKGVAFPAGSGGPLPTGGEGTFPAGTTLLTGPVTAAGAYTNGSGDTNPLCVASGTNPYPSNFMCNPSSIDGIGITDSSQGGGAVFVHAWAHNLQIANNRIYSNAGTLSGGINLGQGEFAPQQIQGATLLDPGSCVSDPSIPLNAQLPYCENLNVNIHNNDISLNSSTGDELFSATPAGAGGVSLCTGSDYYKFNYNWVCGNLSSGDGGGLGHLGMSYNGDIEHNSILFNQSLNPTIPANGGGIVVMGTPDIVPPCGTTTDQDCVAAPGTILPSDGVGPGLVINANLIMGNAAEAGTGGGISFQNINGSEVLAFPTQPSNWWSPRVTNNIIANNVAGWDGGGVSLLDALNLNFVNNTVIHNTTTASAGILFQTIGAPLASQLGQNCKQSATTSCPQPAGLVAIQNSAVLEANLPATITCPVGHYAGTTVNNGTCRRYSYPLLENSIFWQNSAYYIGVGALSKQYQQNVISLYNAFTTTQVTSQHETGECVTGTHFWDIGVRGDTGPTNHASGVTLNPQYSLLTSTSGYGGGNLASDPQAVSPYCNGARTPPESCGSGGCGFNVPPGIADATVPNPIFNLSPVATVDEGNNWINLRWGPFSLTNPATGIQLGNYALAPTSPALDYISAYTLCSGAGTTNCTPSTDFFGNPRPDETSGRVDIGAVEYQGNPTAYAVPTLTSIAPTQGLTSTTFGVTLYGTNLGGTTAVTISGTGVTITGVTVGATHIEATFAIANSAATGARTVTVTTPGGTSNGVTFTVVAPPTLTSITPTSGDQGTVVPVTLTGANLTGTTALNFSATGITAGALTVNAAGTSLTTSLTIAANATLGAGTISATTPIATGNTVTFTVLPPAPTLTSIAPTSGARGTSVAVTLTGNNLTGATAVTVSGTGVTHGALTVTPTTVTTTFTITAGATLSARTVSVTTPSGVSNTVTFTITGPTLTSIAPTSGVRGTTVPVTLTGADLQGATAVTISGTGVNCSGITSTATTINASCAITAGATASARNVTATTPNGTTNSLTGAFTVQGPTLTSIAPTSGARGTTVPVTLTGTNLTGATAVTMSGTGINCTGVTSTATTVSASCAITAGAALGARTVTATTPIGTTNTVAFTVVNPPVATLTSVTPNSSTVAQRGTTVPVTLAGTNFTTGSTVAVSGAGITVSGVTVVSSTQITANFAISSGTTNTGAHNVTVTNASGTASNSVTFTKN